MKRWIFYLKHLRRFASDRRVLLAAAALGIALYVSHSTSRTADVYVSHSPAMTQQFTGVLSEGMLVDFCYQVRTIQGVTGVTYRDFSPARRTATITVYYDARETSIRQIKIFMQGSSVLWNKPKAT